MSKIHHEQSHAGTTLSQWEDGISAVDVACVYLQGLFSVSLSEE